MSDNGGHPAFEALGQANWPSRASIIIRHAERFPIETSVSTHHIGLTDKGKADAVAFGTRLVGYEKLRLFYSPAKRCRETAECIAVGAARAGLDVIGPELAEDLSGSMNILDESCLRLADKMGADFIRAWFSGCVDLTTIKELSLAAEEMTAPIVKRLLGDGTPGLLDINVSHDWNIMALRERYLGLRHEEVGWLGFLDGLALYPGASGVVIAYGRHGAPLGNGTGHR